MSNRKTRREILGLGASSSVVDGSPLSIKSRLTISEEKIGDFSHLVNSSDDKSPPVLSGCSLKIDMFPVSELSDIVGEPAKGIVVSDEIKSLANTDGCCASITIKPTSHEVRNQIVGNFRGNKVVALSLDYSPFSKVVDKSRAIGINLNSATVAESISGNLIDRIANVSGKSFDVRSVAFFDDDMKSSSMLLSSNTSVSKRKSRPVGSDRGEPIEEVLIPFVTQDSVASVFIVASIDKNGLNVVPIALVFGSELPKCHAVVESIVNNRLDLNNVTFSGHEDIIPPKTLGVNVPDARASEESTPMEVTASTELVLGSIRFEADADNPRFLRFHDAVLARAETNANRDALDEDGIKELAATIAGTPVDLEHDPRKNVGFYTAGRADGGALKVDGVLWLDRCDALGVNPAEIEDGTYKLSIEAEAQTAECSICHTVHNSVASYCQHLKNKLVYKATRFLKGLRAAGGALTKTPAGSDTVFSGLYFVASHQLEDSMDNELTANEVVELWINSIVGAITKREDVSPADKKRAEKEYGDVEYADEKNKKYPLDKEHIHAAWSYINMPKNAAKYSPEELKTIKSRIKRAAKKYGMEIADDEKKSKSESSKKEPIMAEKEKEETPEEEKKESPAEEKKEEENKTEACDMPDMKKAEMTADDYATMSKKVADMAAELEANKVALKAAEDAKASVEAKYHELETQITTIKAALDEAQSTIKASRTNELKSKLVGTVMDEAEFTKRTDELLGLPEAALELLARVSKSTERKPEENRLAASEQVPDNGKIKIIL